MEDNSIKSEGIAILYYSSHHGNTKKLLDAIAEKHEVTLIDITEGAECDLTGYSCIGIASGIYAGSFAKQMIQYVEDHLPEEKPVFYIYTSAMGKGGFLGKIRAAVQKMNGRELGAYGCRGYNTVGPFKIVGGTGKGHPTESEIASAVRFYEKMMTK